MKYYLEENKALRIGMPYVVPSPNILLTKVFELLKHHQDFFSFNTYTPIIIVSAAPEISILQKIGDTFLIMFFTFQITMPSRVTGNCATRQSLEKDAQDRTKCSRRLVNYHMCSQ